VQSRRWLVRGSWIAAALLVVACSTPKPPSQFESDFDDETKTWTEIQTELPAAPQDADLVKFLVGGASQYRFALDQKALSIGSDGVFRYTLVATSPQGARNVSYEGIRCETAEKKIYATGRTDGTWARSRTAAWSRIEEVGANRQHAALMKEYFCPDSYPARKTSDIVARLKVYLPAFIP
jgi:hypothetical protein